MRYPSLPGSRVPHGSAVWFAFACWASLAPFAADSAAATIHVPSDQPTIQAAINAAVNGDTVVVSNGLYNESIDFLGKSITVRSTTPSLPLNTVIDAGGVGRVVRMANATSTTVLDGFTLYDGHEGTGGGVRIEGPGTVKRCIIQQCTADTFGGGVWATGGAIIEACDIRLNIANNGGGMRVSGNATVRDTTFYANSATNAGGALHVDGAATIEDVDAQQDHAAVAREAWFTGGSSTVQRSRFWVEYAGVGTLIEADTTLTMTNSLVGWGDRSVVVRPGVANATVQLVNCTVAGGSTASLTIESPSNALTVLVRNCVLDSEADGLDSPNYPGISVQYSHVSGGWPGPGNIDGVDVIDPSYYASFELAPGSPACDAGRNFFADPYGTTDVFGKPRFVDHPLADDTGIGTPAIVDMGAFERQAQRIFVKESATGGNDGSSWTNAFTDLQDGLDAAYVALASFIDPVVMIAEGNYRPDRGTGDRTDAFRIKERMWLVGGFAGVAEDEVSERDVAAHRSTLGGAIGAAGTADNSYHVIRVEDFPNTVDAEVVGVTIQRGNADGAAANLNDRGGAVLADDGFAIFSECEIRNNEAEATGGGVAIENGSGLAFFATRFYGNASLGTGSAIGVGNGSLFAESSLVHGNDSVERAAIFVDEGSDATIRLSTIADNTSSAGNTGGILVQTGANLDLDESILWKNLGTSGTLESQNLRVLGTASVNEVTVQGWSGALGGGNCNDFNPKFLLPFGRDRVRGNEDDNYHLAEDSPLLDSTGVFINIFGLHPDLDGNDRAVDLPSVADTGIGPSPKYVDRGCYEMPAPPCVGDLNGDGSVNASDLAILLGAWGAGGGPADLDGSGSVNAADLAVLLGAWGPC
ncbi:MAG: hypothetical protein JNL80_13695 [Phycisphaerae bacterium]|nr:hypothetical protein [Phycisphaerae bacterium]